MRFEGFGAGATRFYEELAADNTRDWWLANRDRYERDIRAPLEYLLDDLAGEFGEGKVFRPNRDTRFSKDKSPYKTHLAASFPLATSGPGSGHGVGGYFHFEPDHSYLGGGMWHPERPRLEAWRALVDRDPRRIHALIDDPAFTAEFGQLEGDQLARGPTGYGPDHPEAHLLRFKDVTFGRRVSDDDALSADLPDRLADSFTVATPVIRMLAELPG
jgi:uncharacterized protein (TIGR02453 family)